MQYLIYIYLKSFANFGRSIISSLYKTKLKKLAVLLNNFVNGQKEDSPNLHWCRTLIDHVKQDFS